MMNITVIGSGYVGLITGVGFAKLNNKVSIVDLNHKLINKLKDGLLPFYEPDLNTSLKDETIIQNLNFFSDYESAINEHTELIFICVQTPTDSDSQKTDTKYIKKALEKLMEFKSYKFNICIKSTVKSELVKNICNEIDLDFNKLTFNPEFLREGSALYDFFNPDRIVIGGYDEDAIKKLLELYVDFDCEKICTDSNSSQIIKYLSNTYLAMRLSFVNETYRLVSENGGNPIEVLNAIGQDVRIGNNYFRPSPGWGGSCFPKDVTEVVNSFQDKFKLPIISKIVESNELQMDWFSDNIIKIANKKQLKHIVLIGAPFKENTDDLRESPTLKIYKRIENKGKNIVIFDKNIKLNVEYNSISEFENLKEDCLYVEMFPDQSNERKNLISKIKSLDNFSIYRMWETI